MSDTGFFLLPTNKLYKKENTKRLKNFPAGYVGSFYRNLADRVDTNNDFFANIANDANIPKEDVQKYLLATSDFAKPMQTNINHYVDDDARQLHLPHHSGPAAAQSAYSALAPRPGRSPLHHTML